MTTYDLIVIGGGVSGLSLAHLAATSGRSVCVVEASGHVGGSFATHTFNELDEFWIELGCHTIYNSYASFIDLMHQNGTAPRMMERGKSAYRLFSGGQSKKLTSALSWPEILMNAWKLFFADKSGQTAREYYSYVFGKTNYERLFKNVLGAVISQDPSEFPADILLKKRPKDKDVPRSFTFNAGLSVFTDALTKSDRITVLIDSPATTVRREGEGWQVQLAGQRLSGNAVALAVQPSIAASLLGDAFRDLTEHLVSIPSVSVESMGVGVPFDAPSIDPFAFIIADEAAPFTSVVSRDVIPNPHHRGFTFHFRPNRLGRDGKLDVIAGVIGMDSADLTHVAEAVHSSPKLAPNHYETIRDIDSALLRADGLYLTGNYFGGLAIEDCLLRSAFEASRLMDT